MIRKKARTILTIAIFNLVVSAGFVYPARAQTSWSCYLIKLTPFELQGDTTRPYAFRCTRPAQQNDHQYFQRQDGSRVVALQSKTSAPSGSPDQIGSWEIRMLGGSGMIVVEYDGVPPSGCKKSPATNDQNIVATWTCGGK
ncbi:MAG: hypothetical protein AB7E05_12830 [Sphingobium sp.]|uniref:hypothetical protein n=1 Tax=Sphingobium baderi TaxID=1332080 RepID=UPI002B414B15|nr:hypothetical protein [Sphingobium baderi]WRD75283.1 hypothetical protein QQ987_10780 [Sphingobium baderi]